MRFAGSPSVSRTRSWRGMGLGLVVAALSCMEGVKGLISADTIYTDSVTYCSEAKGVLVNQFDIKYHKINNSVTFSISAASVDPNLNVAANVYANAYGRNLVNLTINLCDYLQGVLCPLPMINFTGYGTYPIPSSYTDDIPGLAWTVPDLEAFARVSLTNTQTGEVAACLSATLSNGLSTQQTAVKWASAGLVIAALLIGLIHSTLRWSPSPAVYRWYDVLYVFQAAAASGLLNVNYPSVYLNFVLNFPWALGLFYDANIQDAIVDARNSTGGKLPTQAFAAVDYINRKLSPYNEVTAVQLNQYFRAGATASDFHAFRALPAVAVSNSSAVPLELVKRVEIPTVSQQGIITTLRNGIPVYSNSVGIPQANAFMTIFIIYLICIAIVLGAHAVWGVVMYLADRSRRTESRGTGWVGHQRRGFWSFFAGNMMRLCLIFLFPVFIFALYQFDIGRSDSWLTIFLAAICFAWTVIGLTAVLVFAVFKSRRKTILNISGLYTSYGWYNSAGMVYRQYRPRYHFWWYAPLALASFVRAAFIAFGYRNPWAQVIGLVVVEFLVLVTCVAFRPHKDKKGDWLGAFLALCRMIAFGLMIAFIPSMDVDPIIRTILGFVVLVFFGVPVVLLFFGLLFNLAYGYAFRRHKRRIEDGTEVIGSDVRSDYGSDTPAMVQTGPPLHHGDSGEVPVNAGNGFRNYDESTSLAPPVEPAGSTRPASYRNSYHPSIDGEEPAYGYNAGYGNHQYGHQPNAYGNGYAPNQYGNGYADNQVRSAYESAGQQQYYGNDNAYDGYDNSGYGRPVNQGRRSHLEI